MSTAWASVARNRRPLHATHPGATRHPSVGGDRSMFSEGTEFRSQKRLRRSLGALALLSCKRQFAHLGDKPIMQAGTDYFAQLEDSLITDPIIHVEAVFPSAD